MSKGVKSAILIQLRNPPYFLLRRHIRIQNRLDGVNDILVIVYTDTFQPIILSPFQELTVYDGEFFDLQPTVMAIDHGRVHGIHHV